MIKNAQSNTANSDTASLAIFDELDELYYATWAVERYS